MLSACERQAPTSAASSGCAASQAATASLRSAGNSPSTKACNSSSVTGESRSIMGSPSSLFHAAKRRALAVEIVFDLYARTRQTRHHGTDRHALYFRDFAIAEAFQHHQQQGMALVLDQRGERAFDVAAARFRTGQVRSVVVLDRQQHRPPRQRAPPVAVEIGEDRVQPAAHVAAMEQMLRAQRPHQRVLNQIVGDVGIPRQRAGIPPQRRDRRLNVLPERGQACPLLEPHTELGTESTISDLRRRQLLEKTPQSRSYSRKRIELTKKADRSSRFA